MGKRSDLVIICSCLVQTIKSSLPEFDEIVLSPKLKDFIAYQMSQEDWKQILRNYLQNESESRIQKQHENSIYDQAYAVIILLIKKEIVSNWYDMEDILNQFNKGIVKDFWEKFNKKTPVQG